MGIFLLFVGIYAHLGSRETHFSPRRVREAVARTDPKPCPLPSKISHGRAPNASPFVEGEQDAEGMEHLLDEELLRRRVRVLVVGCGGTGSAFSSGLTYCRAALDS
jgi:hypothetical protein